MAGGDGAGGASATGHSRYRGLLPFVLALLAFLLLQNYLILGYHHDRMSEEATAHGRDKLGYLVQLIRGAALSHDYALIEQFIGDAARRDANMVGLRAVAPNGFMISGSRRERGLAGEHVIHFREPVALGGELLLHLEMDYSLDAIDREIHVRGRELILASVVLALAMALLLWGLMRHSAVRPLEREVAARRLAERGLREQEAQFRNLFDNIADGIILADPDTTRFLAANAAMGRMLGYTPEEMATLGVTDLHPPEELPRELARFAEAAAHERWLLPEVPMLRRDGSVFYADISTFYTRYAGKRCLSGTFRDISERRRMTRQLEQLNRELEGRVAAAVAAVREKDRLLFHQARYAQMGEMLSMIAHQWRQPLTALNTAGIELAVKSALEAPSREEVERFTRYLERQVKGMSATIDDFMEFFRPDQRCEEFGLPAVVEELWQLMGPQLHNRGIELLVEVPEAPPLSGHRRALEQVLINLVANARDAYEDSPGEGQRRIELRASAVEAGMRIEVEDHAGGIPAGVLERVFDPYFTTKEQGKGTGIGLYMSRTLVERDFGGRLTVENGADGARFVLTLPLEAPDHG